MRLFLMVFLLTAFTNNFSCSALELELTASVPSGPATASPQKPVDSSKVVKYVSGHNEAADTPDARRGSKVYDHNEPTGKWGRLSAALALTSMIFGLIFLARFMRRRTCRAKV